MDLDTDFLKYLVVNGSLFEAAVALAILDKETGGKVTEFVEKYMNTNAPFTSPVQVRQGAEGKKRKEVRVWRRKM